MDNPVHPLPLYAALSAAALLWCAAAWRWRRRIRAFLRAYGSFLRQAFRAPPALWLLAIPLAGLAATLPFEYDEAYTFLKFTHRTVLHSVATYPAPNNHVLHSVCTNLSWLLLGWTRSELAVRLPAIGFTLLTLAFASRVFLSRHTLSTALLAVALLWSDSFFVYAFQARGYSLQGLLAVAGLAAIIRMQDFSVGHRFAALLLTSILGLFTSPAYLYAAAPLGLLFLVAEGEGLLRVWRKALAAVTLAGATVVLLYAPILLNEGPGALASNRFVTPVADAGLREVLRHSLGIVSWVVWPGGAGLCLAAGTVLLAGRGRRIAWLAFLLLPIPMMLVLRQLPFERVFHANGLVVVVFAITGLHRWVDRRAWRPLAAIPLVAILVAPAFLRLERRYGRSAFFSAFAMRRIEAHAGSQGRLLAWRLHWVYLDPQHARERLQAGGRFVALPDTTSRFPAEGLLLSSRRIPVFECLDTILHPSDPRATCYVYRLKAAGEGRISADRRGAGYALSASGRPGPPCRRAPALRR